MDLNRNTMTREERYHKIDKAFPYEPITSDKEDITRVLDTESKPKAWVGWAAGILVVCSLLAYIYSNYIVTPGQ